MDEPILATLALDARCMVAESPVWDSERRCLLFTDILAGTLHEWRPADGSRRSWQFEETVGSFGLCRSGRLVVALRRRVVFLSRDDGTVTDFLELPEPDHNRLNDGKVGPDGCFWVGSMDDRSVKEPTGRLYRVMPTGGAECKGDGFVVSNGLAWSNGATTMFHSDSRSRLLYAHDFDVATGRLSRRRLIATLTDEEGRPDGGACDDVGTYWSAGVTAGCLNRFSSEGKLLEKHPIPTPAPTMPCFAGPDLFITSLREGFDDEQMRSHPTSGGIFRASAPVTGVPIERFRDA